MTDRLAAAEALLADLVGFASISGQPNGDIVNYIKTYLESHGIIVHLDSHEDGQRFNLFTSIGPQIDDGILVTGHVEVVPAIPASW